MRALILLALPVALLATSPVRAEPVDRWRAHIAEASQRFGIPESWIERVMRVESGGRSHLAGRPTTSPKGAMGLMQVMPATWAMLTRRHGLGSDPYEPRANILAGTAYLRAMHDRFGYPGLFAAYNAGPGRYATFLAGRSTLPTETRLYLGQMTGPGARTMPGASSRLSPSPVDTGLFAVRRNVDMTGDGTIAAPSLGHKAALFVVLGRQEADLR